MVIRADMFSQRDGGWSMRGTKVLDWLLMVVQSIRKVLPKKLIRVRFHPGDKNTGVPLPNSIG